MMILDVVGGEWRPVGARGSDLISEAQRIAPLHGLALPGQATMAPRAYGEG